MRFAPLFVVCLLTVASANRASEPVKLTDEQLRQQIVGLWFNEMKSGEFHIVTRVQYLPNGRFVADYRFSALKSNERYFRMEDDRWIGPFVEDQRSGVVAPAKYCRMVGTWQVSGGTFFERPERYSDPEIKPPTLSRRVTALDDKRMIVEMPNYNYQSTWFWRGEAKLGTNVPSVDALDTKEFLAALEAMHMSGYREAVDKDGKASFRLDTRPAWEAAKAAESAESSHSPTR